MRKQYHLWRPETGDGVDAWDVDRLIDLSAHLPVHDVAIDSIDDVDSVYWFDQEGNRPTVRAIVEHVRLVNEVDTSYPIILSPDGRVMDGMHRIARAILEGRRTIRAVRLTELPAPDHRNCNPSELSYDR